MKTYIKIGVIFCLLLIGNHTFAQKQTELENSDIKGFFLTASDFKANKITIPTDMKHKGDKIKLNGFFISDFITVTENGEKIKYAKDSIFAIKDESGTVYRFISGNPSKIVDTSFLFIYEYRTTKTVNNGQNSKRSITKQIPVTLYYFSYKTHTQIYSLTMDNIRNFVLNDIPQVHTKICSKYTNDKLLNKISPNSGNFIINETFKEFLKN